MKYDESGLKIHNKLNENLVNAQMKQEKKENKKFLGIKNNINDLRKLPKKLVYEEMGILDQMKSLNTESHHLKDILNKNKEKGIILIKENQNKINDHVDLNFYKDSERIDLISKRKKNHENAKEANDKTKHQQLNNFQPIPLTAHNSTSNSKIKLFHEKYTNQINLKPTDIANSISNSLLNSKEKILSFQVNMNESPYKRTGTKATQKRNSQSSKSQTHNSNILSNNLKPAKSKADSRKTKKKHSNRNLKDINNINNNKKRVSSKKLKNYYKVDCNSRSCKNISLGDENKNFNYNNKNNINNNYNNDYNVINYDYLNKNYDKDLNCIKQIFIAEKPAANNSHSEQNLNSVMRTNLNNVIHKNNIKNNNNTNNSESNIASLIEKSSHKSVANTNLIVKKKNFPHEIKNFQSDFNNKNFNRENSSIKNSERNMQSNSQRSRKIKNSSKNYLQNKSSMTSDATSRMQISQLNGMLLRNNSNSVASNFNNRFDKKAKLNFQNSLPKTIYLDSVTNNNENVNIHNFGHNNNDNYDINKNENYNIFKDYENIGIEEFNNSLLSVSFYKDDDCINLRSPRVNLVDSNIEGNKFLKKIQSFKSNFRNSSRNDYCDYKNNYSLVNNNNSEYNVNYNFIGDGNNQEKMFKNKKLHQSNIEVSKQKSIQSDTIKLKNETMYFNREAIAKLTVCGFNPRFNKTSSNYLNLNPPGTTIKKKFSIRNVDKNKINNSKINNNKNNKKNGGREFTKKTKKILQALGDSSNNMDNLINNNNINYNSYNLTNNISQEGNLLSVSNTNLLNLYSNDINLDLLDNNNNNDTFENKKQSVFKSTENIPLHIAIAQDSKKNSILSKKATLKSQKNTINSNNNNSNNNENGNQNNQNENNLEPNYSEFVLVNSDSSEQKLRTELKRVVIKNMKVYDSLSEDDMSIEKAKLFVISPNSFLKRLLDFFNILACLYTAVYVTLNLIRYTQHLNAFNFALELILEFFMLLDLFFGFFTGYFDFEENYNYFLFDTIYNYMSSFFLVDFLSAIPFHTIFNFADMQYLSFTSFSTSNSFESANSIKANTASSASSLSEAFSEAFSDNFKLEFLFLHKNDSALTNALESKLLKLFKLLRVVKAIKILQKNEFLSSLNQYPKLDQLSNTKSFKFFIYYIYFLIISHMLTCIFIFLGTLDSPNWIMNSNLQDSHFLLIYVASLYFNHTTIFTVGYGDILTKNVYEKAYNIILMIVGLMLYSFALSSISELIQQNDEKVKQYDKKKEYLQHLSSKYYIRKKLFDKISKHLKYEMREDKTNKNVLLADLPISLRNELIININKDIIFSFNYFKGCDDHDFVINVIMALKPTKSSKRDLLLKQGEFVEEIIFVKKGYFDLKVSFSNNELDLNPSSLKELAENKHNNSININNNESERLNRMNNTLTPGENLLAQANTNEAGKASEKNVLGFCRSSSQFDFNRRYSSVSKKPTFSQQKQNTKNLGMKNGCGSENNLMINNTFNNNNNNNKYFDHINSNCNNGNSLSKNNINNSKHKKNKNALVKFRILSLRQNEYFGDALMIENKRSPVNIETQSKTAEIFLMSKADLIRLIDEFPEIIEKQMEKSYFNLEQIENYIEELREAHNKKLERSVKQVLFHNLNFNNSLFEKEFSKNKSELFERGTIHNNIKFNNNNYKSNNYDNKNNSDNEFSDDSESNESADENLYASSSAGKNTRNFNNGYKGEKKNNNDNDDEINRSGSNTNNKTIVEENSNKVAYSSSGRDASNKNNNTNNHNKHKGIFNYLKKQYQYREEEEEKENIENESLEAQKAGNNANINTKQKASKNSIAKKTKSLSYKSSKSKNSYEIIKSFNYTLDKQKTKELKNSLYSNRSGTYKKNKQNENDLCASSFINKENENCYTYKTSFSQSKSSKKDSTFKNKISLKKIALEKYKTNNLSEFDSMENINENISESNEDGKCRIMLKNVIPPMLNISPFVNKNNEVNASSLKISKNYARSVNKNMKEEYSANNPNSFGFKFFDNNLNSEKNYTENLNDKLDEKLLKNQNIKVNFYNSEKNNKNNNNNNNNNKPNFNYFNSIEEETLIKNLLRSSSNNEYFNNSRLKDNQQNSDFACVNHKNNCCSNENFDFNNVDFNFYEDSKKNLNKIEKEENNENKIRLEIYDLHSKRSSINIPSELDDCNKINCIGINDIKCIFPNLNETKFDINQNNENSKYIFNLGEDSNQNNFYNSLYYSKNEDQNINNHESSYNNNHQNIYEKRRKAESQKIKRLNSKKINFNNNYIKNNFEIEKHYSFNNINKTEFKSPNKIFHVNEISKENNIIKKENQIYNIKNLFKFNKNNFDINSNKSEKIFENFVKSSSNEIELTPKLPGFEEEKKSCDLKLKQILLMNENIKNSINKVNRTIFVCEKCNCIIEKNKQIKTNSKEFDSYANLFEIEKVNEISLSGSSTCIERVDKILIEKNFSSKKTKMFSNNNAELLKKLKQDLNSIRILNRKIKETFNFNKSLELKEKHCFINPSLNNNNIHYINDKIKYFNNKRVNSLQKNESIVKNLKNIRVLISKPKNSRNTSNETTMKKILLKNIASINSNNNNNIKKERSLIKAKSMQKTIIPQQRKIESDFSSSESELNHEENFEIFQHFQQKLKENFKNELNMNNAGRGRKSVLLADKLMLFNSSKVNLNKNNTFSNICNSKNNNRNYNNSVNINNNNNNFTYENENDFTCYPKKNFNDASNNSNNNIFYKQGSEKYLQTLSKSRKRNKGISSTILSHVKSNNSNKRFGSSKIILKSQSNFNIEENSDVNNALNNSININLQNSRSDSRKSTVLGLGKDAFALKNNLKYKKKSSMFKNTNLNFNANSINNKLNNQKDSSNLNENKISDENSFSSNEKEIPNDKNTLKLSKNYKKSCRLQKNNRKSRKYSVNKNNDSKFKAKSWQVDNNIKTNNLKNYKISSDSSENSLNQKIPIRKIKRRNNSDKLFSNKAAINEESKSSFIKIDSSLSTSEAKNFKVPAAEDKILRVKSKFKISKDLNFDEENLLNNNNKIKIYKNNDARNSSVKSFQIKNQLGSFNEKKINDPLNNYYIDVNNDNFKNKNNNNDYDDYFD